MAVENLHPVGDYYGNVAMDQAIGAAAGVQVVLDLPAKFTLPADTGDWTCSEGTEGTLCVHPDPLHAADTVTLEAVYAPAADDIGEYAFAATASAIPADPDMENNAVEANVTVIPAPKPDETDDGNMDDDTGSDTDDGTDAGTGTDDEDTAGTPPVRNDGGGGALGWLALLLAPLVRSRRAG